MRQDSLEGRTTPCLVPITRKNPYGGMAAIVEADLFRRKHPKANDNWADPVAGKGPKSNQVGSEVDKSTWSRLSRCNYR